MKNRTKAYANRIIKLCSALTSNWIAQTLGKQPAAKTARVSGRA